MPPWIVIHTITDLDRPQRSWSSLFRFAVREVAEGFADSIDEYHASSDDWGSHTWVFDAADPAAYSDPAEYYELFAEEKADDVYQEVRRKGGTEEEADKAYDEAYEAVMQERSNT